MRTHLPTSDTTVIGKRHAPDDYVPIPLVVERTDATADAAYDAWLASVCDWLDEETK